MLARAEAAELVLADLSGMRRGTLALYASQTIASDWLPRHLVAFRRTYPEIALRLPWATPPTPPTRCARAGRTRLRRGGVDDPTLASTTIARGPTRSRGRPNHHFAGATALAPEDLAGADWVLREAGSGTRSAFEAALTEAGLAPAQLRVTLELPSNEACAPPSRPGAGHRPVRDRGRRRDSGRDPGAGGVRVAKRPFGCCATRSATAVGPPTRCSNSSQRRIPDERACETRAPPDDPRVRLAEDRTRRRPGRLALPAEVLAVWPPKVLSLTLIASFSGAVWRDRAIRARLAHAEIPMMPRLLTVGSRPCRSRSRSSRPPPCSGREGHQATVTRTRCQAALR